MLSTVRESGGSENHSRIDWGSQSACHGRQVQSERRAEADALAGRLDVTAVCLDDATHDRQTDGPPIAACPQN